MVENLRLMASRHWFVNALVCKPKDGISTYVIPACTTVRYISDEFQFSGSLYIIDVNFFGGNLYISLLFIIALSVITCESIPIYYIYRFKTNLFSYITLCFNLIQSMSVRFFIERSIKIGGEIRIRWTHGESRRRRRKKAERLRRIRDQ